LKSKFQLLKQSRLFENASESVLEKVCSIVKEKKLIAGKTLFHKGDSGDSMFIIASGRMLVHDADLKIAYLAKNDVFGEMAALDGEKRTASLTALENTLLIQIKREQLFALGTREPEIAKALIHFLCQREKYFIDDIAEQTLKIRTMIRELEIAAEIQSSFLPPKLPDVPGWKFNALFRAAKNVAGDFYDAFKLDDHNSIGFVIGDVCGKGIGAAIFMALFRSLIRANMLSNVANCKSPPSEENIKQLLLNSFTAANSYISTTHYDSMMFATIFAAVIFPDTGEIFYVNAGHNSPYILNRNGVTETLINNSPAVGIFPNAEFKVNQAKINNNDMLLGFTDGVTEAVNPKNQQFSEERLIKIFVKNINNGIDTAVDQFKRSFDKFCGNVEQFDDITILALSRKN
jgi:serine phosphatase RsbU (regulator of sigma subunit)